MIDYRLPLVLMNRIESPVVLSCHISNFKAAVTELRTHFINQNNPHRESSPIMEAIRIPIRTPAQILGLLPSIPHRSIKQHRERMWTQFLFDIIILLRDFGRIELPRDDITTLLVEMVDLDVALVTSV